MSVGGFNCPWCRAYNAKGERVCFRCGKPLTSPAFAGALRSLRGQEFLATKCLAALSIFVFALELAAQGRMPLDRLASPTMSTLLRFGGIAGGLERSEPYRLLGACFVHLGFLHIVMNMIALGVLGAFVEPIVGSARMVIAYVLTGVVGFVVSTYVHPLQATAGASGAIFGINGVALASMALHRDPRFKDMLFRTGLQLLIFTFLPFINNSAHAGGLVCGVLLGVLFGLEKRPSKYGVAINVAAGVSAALCVASVVLPHFSPIWREVAAHERAQGAAQGDLVLNWRAMDPAFEAVIGLEVHAQLLTRTKLFCACATSFGAPPNTHVCPVCLGLPGALPVPNDQAVELAVKAALALGLTVHETSVFSRKNYFYPDLPKGYQITQFDRPISTSGHLRIETPSGEKLVGITRIHLEEDAGKNLHTAGAESVVDLNRAGTALIEIVGEPDLRSAEEAVLYLKGLRDVLVFLGVNDGNLEEGSFRCDANVSVRRPGEPFGTRCEIKNVNSFRFVEKAINFEIARQIELVKTGQKVRQETRGWAEKDERTFTLRSKEEAHDYRYFPDPDLPPLVLEPGFVASVQKALPETPAEKRVRYVALGLPPSAAGVMTGHPKIAAFFETTLAAYGGEAKKAANFLASEVLAGTTTAGLDATFPVTPAQVAELLALVDGGTISGKQAKEVYAAIANSETTPGAIVKERNMAVIVDEAALEAIAKAIIEANPKQAAGYRSGKTGLLGFFVGAVMKETKGSGSPAVVNDVLKRLLEG